MKSFSSLGAFLEHLAGAGAAHIERSVAHGMKDAGEIIQREAQAEIGHYQDAAGPFPEWAPLAQSTLDGFTDKHGHHHPGKIELGFAPPDNPLLRTGGLSDHIEMAADATHAVVGVPDETVGIGGERDPMHNIGDVAIDLELGTARIPPRSFLGRAAYVKGHDAVKAIAHAVTDGFAGVPHRPPPKSASDDVPF